jgi:predicted phosphate transport protein (TIGR00153 family)
MRFRLIPRDEGFYPLFEQQAARAAETAVQLELLMRSLPVVPDQVDSIVAAERAGDEVMRTVRSRLETSIVTPFDREDIQELANSLDDVLDEMRAAASIAQSHKVTAHLSGVTDLVGLLRQIAEANVALIGKLRTLKKLSDDIDVIDHLEREADATYRRIVTELFNGRHEAIEILKWKDVIEAIERAINAVQDASHVVQAIAVKHA